MRVATCKTGAWRVRDTQHKNKQASGIALAHRKPSIWFVLKIVSCTHVHTYKIVEKTEKDRALTYRKPGAFKTALHAIAMHVCTNCEMQYLFFYANDLFPIESKTVPLVVLHMSSFCFFSRIFSQIPTMILTGTLNLTLTES